MIWQFSVKRVILHQHLQIWANKKRVTFFWKKYAMEIH